MHGRSSTETRINLRIMVRFTNDVLLSRDYLRIARELRRTANERKKIDSLPEREICYFETFERSFRDEFSQRENLAI